MRIQRLIHAVVTATVGAVSLNVVGQATGVSTVAAPAAAPLALYVVHLTTGPAWDATKPPNEQPGMREHSANLARLRSEGKIVIGARYKDSHADKGMIVLRLANRGEVDAEFAKDPMVVEKRFIADIAEFRPFYDGFVPRPARVDTTKPLAKFAWLAGCWQGQSGTMTFREHWMPDAGGMMMAMSRTMRGDKVVSYEAIRIELDADTVPTYVPKPSGQAEVRFKLASDIDGRFVFENMQHDFPQRIIYQRNTNGGLLARIEGERDGKSRAVEFPMKRAGCE